MRYAEDLRSLGFLAALTLLLAFQWTGLYRHWLLLPFTCLLTFAACIAKHNHVHCPTFAGAGWNAAFSLWLSLLTGQPTTGILTAHNEIHHQHNNQAVDFVRCSVVNFHRNWLNLLSYPFACVWAMYREKPSDLKRWQSERPRLYRQAILERFATYLFIGTALITDWKATLVFLLAPWFAAQWALVAINLLQHQDCDTDSEYDHSRNITGKTINWLFLNNGFHTAHHMYPAAHWSRLPEIHRVSVAPHMRSDLDESSLLGAVWRRFVLEKGWRSRAA